LVAAILLAVLAFVCSTVLGVFGTRLTHAAFPGK
jgi:hypothetical protein